MRSRLLILLCLTPLSAHAQQDALPLAPEEAAVLAVALREVPGVVVLAETTYTSAGSLPAAAFDSPAEAARDDALIDQVRQRTRTPSRWPRLSGPLRGQVKRRQAARTAVEAPEVLVQASRVVFSRDGRRAAVFLYWQTESSATGAIYVLGHDPQAGWLITATYQLLAAG